MRGTEEKMWLHFLSRFIFFLPLPVLLLFLSIGILLSSSGDTPIELAYMISASEKPIGLRLAGLSLNLLWGSVAVFFIALAGFFKNENPIKSTFLGAIGIGFIIPMSAGNLQWTAALDMAKRYGNATAEQQELLKEIQMTVFQIVESRIDTANLLWGLGIVIFIILARKLVPLYIRALYMISAAIMLLVFLSNFLGFTFPFVLIPVFWLVTLVAHVALGIVFYKKNKSVSPINAS
ncbi:hypothetical protein DRW41_03960 [Neobacillus piezotolerans]|uniref:DUF4386 domain-containing protein n=1 Tax=Neobacillus piezotolerans TaxID=2259171 RepID=A0A3D8GW86_9BACI|nr:hypothetical protein [Neobacillus piezotolerans]RDU38723.1 hypothetical protein DRW41_03960 [Neobacillus piezotolerans]